MYLIFNILEYFLDIIKYKIFELKYGMSKNIQELIFVYIRFKINPLSINMFNISHIY